MLKNSVMTVLWLFGIWSTLERWKSSTSRCLNSWPQSKNIIMFKCCLLLEFYAMMNHFSTRLWHATKSGFYTTGDDQLSVWTKKFQSTSQSQTRTWSLFGGLLLVWSTKAFWILAKPLHLRSMLSKLMRCTKNCNACSCHGSTETAQFSTTMPDHTLHNQCFQSWTNWAVEFCFIHHICLTSVVIYGCERWTIKKAECWRISNCTREDFWESLEQQGDQTSQF